MKNNKKCSCKNLKEEFRVEPDEYFYESGYYKLTCKNCKRVLFDGNKHEYYMFKKEHKEINKDDIL
jgi:hypothetical protein